MRTDFEEVLAKSGVLDKLAEFRPIVIGTPPLGIALPSSDIDIACEARDLGRFREVTSALNKGVNAFQCRALDVRGQSSVVVSFEFCDWTIELFCQTVPVECQMGVRHFLIEKRLLTLHPALRSIVVSAKLRGLKTEPAFALALGLSGDPYETLLSLESLSDAELAAFRISSIA